MSNGNPWGNTTPDNQDPNKSYNALPQTPGSGDQSSGQTGLGASTYGGHTWGLTDLWGGDNKYADWSLGPQNFAPQGDSAAFYDALAQQYAGRNAGNIAGAYGGANQAWNQYQANMGNVNGSLGLLANAANGNAPSQAQIQQQQGIQQSIAAQQALASSARGGPGAWAAAQNNAVRQGSAMQQSSIQQGMAMRAAEMAQARGQYAQMAQGAGNMSLQAQQQMGQYGMGMQKQDDASMMGLLGYGQSAGQIANQQENAWNNVVSGATSNNAGNANSAAGATAAAFGTAFAAMSDANAKTMVQDEGARPSSDYGSIGSAMGSMTSGSGSSPPLVAAMARALGSDARKKALVVPEGHVRGAYERSASEEMLDNLRPVSFNYKQGTGEDPSARRFGVMAQDLERSRMGKSLVIDTPRGKHIDVTHAMGAVLAAQADLNARMKAVEGKR